MRLKKILINSLVTALISAPFITLAFINIFPKKDLPDTRYLIDDNKILNEQKEILQTALDDTIGKNEQLKFKFYTLTRTNQYTPSMLSWFTELNKSLNALDNRLSFELVPRTNQTVETGFRNRNGEMISMFWSPDYHNIGTWIGLHFYPNYQTPNLWPSLYKFLSSDMDKIDPGYYGPVGSEFDPKIWGTELKNFLKDIKYPSTTYPNAETVFQSNDKLIALDRLITENGNNQSFSKVGAREDVANKIALWADMNNDLAIGLVNWMDHQNSALPWISSGPNTTLKLLVRDGYHTPINEYSGLTFRDWYFNDSNPTPNKNFTWWNATDPFATNTTPYNSSFNNVTNNMFFQSTYNGLVDWKIIGDWEYDDDTKNWTPPQHSFFMSGASKIEFSNDSSFSSSSYSLAKNANKDNLEIPIDNDNYRKALLESNYIRFTVDEKFPWLNYKGETVSELKAQDYFWGLMGYHLSSKWGINTNSYYLNLMNLDIEKTIELNKDFYTKDSKGNILPKINNDKNEITFALTEPNINFLDLLSKQYFQPLPIENKLAQNIFDLQKTTNDQGQLDGNPDFNTLYGSGEQKSNYQGWWSAGAYYINSVSDQDIQFTKNDEYFKTLTNDNKNELFGVSIDQKIKRVVMKYAGAYSPQVTYEQFKTGEIDKSDIPDAQIPEALKMFPKDFRTEGVSIVSRTDLIPYNTNVYIVDDYLEIDKNRSLKNLVSPQYEKAIVRDFNEGISGNSWKIRNAINQSVNWYSLASLAIPNDGVSFQQSIVPFGNVRGLDGANLTDIADFNNRTTYWQTAADNEKIGFLRLTLDQYIADWKKQFTGIKK